MEGLKTRSKNHNLKGHSSNILPSSSSRLNQYSNTNFKDFNGSLRDNKIKESFEEIQDNCLSFFTV